MMTVRATARRWYTVLLSDGIRWRVKARTEADALYRAEVQTGVAAERVVEWPL